MEYWEPTALFLQTHITLTSFKQMIKLESTQTSPQLNCTKKLQRLEDSMSIIGPSSQSLIKTLMEILLHSLVIGTRPTTRCNNVLYPHGVPYDETEDAEQEKL